MQGLHQKRKLYTILRAGVSFLVPCKAYIIIEITFGSQRKGVNNLILSTHPYY